MSAHVLLDFLHESRKRFRMRGLPFCNGTKHEDEYLILNLSCDTIRTLFSRV